MNQIELNKELYEECIKRKIDINRIEALLEKGADPLGPIYENDNKILLYGEICNWETHNLYMVTKIFLEHGMKISKEMFSGKNEFYDPIWNFAFKCDKDGIKTFKLLLDNNLDVDLIEDTINHIYTDYIFLGFPDAKESVKINKEKVDYHFEIAVKMILLSASYDYFFEKSEYLKNVIDAKHNNYKRQYFRNYKNYYIKIEKGMINVCDKFTEEIVWEFPIE